MASQLRSSWWRALPVVIGLGGCATMPDQGDPESCVVGSGADVGGLLKASSTRFDRDCAQAKIARILASKPNATPAEQAVALKVMMAQDPELKAIVESVVADIEAGRNPLIDLPAGLACTMTVGRPVKTNHDGSRTFQLGGCETNGPS